MVVGNSGDNNIRAPDGKQNGSDGFIPHILG